MTTFLIILAPLLLIAFAVLSRLLQIRANRRASLPYISPGGPLPDFFHGHTWPNPNRRSH